MSVLRVTNTVNVPFNVRLVSRGDSYGLDNDLARFCDTHDSAEPLIEFYDARHDNCELGKFLGQYSAKILSRPGREGGLNLRFGEITDWFIDTASMQKVSEFILDNWRK